MLFSIPNGYLSKIQDKFDIKLLVNYRQTYYEKSNTNEDEIKELYKRIIDNEEVSFTELVQIDSIYEEVIDDIKEYTEKEFTQMINAEKNGIAELTAKKKNAWKVQRNRWKKNVTVRKSAYKVLEIIRNDRTAEEWQEKYKCFTLEEYVANLEKKVTMWHKQRDYFYNFPFFEWLTEKQKQSGLKHDLDRFLLELLEKDKVFDYYITKPDYLTDKPIYTEKREQIRMRRDEDGTLKAVVPSEDAEITYLPLPKESGIEDNFVFSLLNPEDHELVDYIMTHMPRLYTDPIQSFSLSELAVKVLGWHGSSGVENVRKRLLNMVRPASYKDDDMEINLTFFDSCAITHGKIDETSNVEQQIAIIAPGRYLREAYIKNQLTYIIRSQYECLELPLSKHFCYTFQRERVGLASYNQVLTVTWGVNYFKKIVNFGTNDKKNIVSKIKSSLDEFVRLKFIIQEYTYKNSAFTITFYPLSEAEKKDLENIRNLKMKPGIEEKE